MCHKTLGELEQATLYFNRALEWAQAREDFSSECITQGQLGVVELLKKNNQQAQFHFNQCYESSRDMKNLRL